MKPKGLLTFFCGKMGAGKSTAATKLASETDAVLVSEDEWLASHYPDQIQSFDDYLQFSKMIKPFVKQHIQNILKTGTDVVMDFPANTISQRSWFVGLCSEIECPHKLVYLDVSDQQCLKQIANRRIEQPQRADFDTEDMFVQVSAYFQPPGEDENLNIVHVF